MYGPVRQADKGRIRLVGAGSDDAVVVCLRLAGAISEMTGPRQHRPIRHDCEHVSHSGRAGQCLSKCRSVVLVYKCYLICTIRELQGRFRLQGRLRAQAHS